MPGAAECEVLALEKAEALARGAALKWASGVFCRPEQLGHLGHYRRREKQRNNSIQARLKSTVQSYLEGAELGLSQLRLAQSEVHHVRRWLAEAQEVWRESEGSVRRLQEVRCLVEEHVQLTVVIQSLPHIYAVPELVGRTQRLVEEQQLLEAQVNLRELESLRDEILHRLQKVGPLVRAGLDEDGGPEALDLVSRYFAGVKEVSSQLANAVFSLARSALDVARSDPASLVSAVRIIEREELLDAEEWLGHARQPWRPPGRPKQWREQFFQALEEGVCERLMLSTTLWEDMNPTDLAKHLKGLQRRMVEELQAVSSVLAPCVPPRYELCQAAAHMCHQAIGRHLRDILSHDLPHPLLYRILHWVTIIYPSTELMAHPDLSLEAELLGPLLPPEMMEEVLHRYTRSVRACLSQWIQKALEVEYSDWQRDQEPEKDPEGFYLSGLQQIVMQMLLENVQLAAILGENLEVRVRSAALCEMDNCLVWLREALVRYGIEHMKDREQPPHYIPYLLSIINACSALSSSITQLQPPETSGPALRKPAPCLQTSLEKTQKKACHLLLDELQSDIQPLLRDVPSRLWLGGSGEISALCERVELFSQYLRQVQPRLQQQLQVQVERMVTIEYVRALLAGKMACRGGAERQLMAQRMADDAQEIKTALLHMGVEDPSLCAPLILALRELFSLADPALLGLEVSALMARYPDISEDHVAALMELRGDVTRDTRNAVLTIVQRQAPPLPDDYRPIFISIPVPAPPPPFCLHPSSCA